MSDAPTPAPVGAWTPDQPLRHDATDEQIMARGDMLDEGGALHYQSHKRGLGVINRDSALRLAREFAEACMARALPEGREGPSDTQLLDRAQELVLCADFAYPMERDNGEVFTESAYLLRIPKGVRVGMDIRAFLRAALSPSPSTEKPTR